MLARRARPQKQEVSRMSWSKIPAELRDSILEFVIASEGAGARISAYAPVCLEWQAFIEAATFKTLVLHQSDVVTFEKYTKAREHLVKHVWLRYELPTDCPEGPVLPSRSIPTTRFQRSIRRLLNSLRSWDKRECNLTLELSIHSPSDLQRWGPHFCFNSRPDEQENFSLPPDHASGASEQVLDASSLQIAVFGCPLELDTYTSLPKAPVVRRLVVRRQTRRKLCRSALDHILRALPALETLHYEAWSCEVYRADDRYGKDMPGRFNPGQTAPIKSSFIGVSKLSWAG